MSPDASRARVFAVAVLLIPLGFWLKYAASGGATGWASAYGAAIAYEVFWVHVAGLMWRRASPWRIAAGVLAVTCALEVLQLWRPAWLQSARATVPGAALLGTVFDPFDFPHYVLGVMLGAALLQRLRR